MSYTVDKKLVACAVADIGILFIAPTFSATVWKYRESPKTWDGAGEYGGRHSGWRTCQGKKNSFGALCGKVWPTKA